jgi:hypothetical protein
MRWALLVCIALAGCDRVLGLSHINGDGGGGDGSGGQRTTVTGTYLLHHSTNGATGVPMPMETPYAPGDVVMQLVANDGSATPVDYQADGTFTFETTVPYRLRIQNPFGEVEIQHDSPNLVLVDRLGGRYPITRVTAMTPIKGMLPAVAGYVVVSSTGIWTQSPIVAVDSGLFTYDWGMFQMEPTIGLLDAGKNDLLWVTGSHFYPGTGENYLAVDSAGSYPVTQTSGVATQLTTPSPSPIARDLCTRVTAQHATAYSRMTAVDPEFTGGGVNWTINAVPALSLSPAADVWVATDGQAAPNLFDIDYDVVYGNPYPGTALTAAMGYTAIRMISLDAAAPYTLPLSGTTWATVSPTTAPTCAPAMLTSTVGIPSRPVFDGVLLGGDGAAVELAGKTGTVALDMPIQAPGPVDRTDVTLFEVLVANNATTLHRIRTVVTTTSTARFDTSLFRPMHSYIFAITTHRGTPDARIGDFGNLKFPIEYVTTWSSMFSAQ